ncbi:hypothetical protein EIP91_008173 [Steccherinum ochraceum]|uniref:Uncharacterized protein n=1 Tax=Steccherinum ochraceum TaxID=92696 RepID=A0A4R0RDB8_9APHY|nr:hypothetical protein EIP91_008173 [Steccherinum ochraceum]
MYSTLFSAALFAAFVGSVSAVQDLKITQPPELTQCQNVKLTWGTSKPPYDIIVAPASDPCNTVLADLGGNHTTTSLTWNTNLKAGTEVVFSLLDDNGDEGWTGSITIKPSNDSSCLPASQQPSTTANVPATTLVVPAGNAQNTPPAVNPPSQAQPTDNGAVPVGAANAGINPLDSGASAFHKFSGASVAISVVAVLLAATL